MYYAHTHTHMHARTYTRTLVRLPQIAHEVSARMRLHSAALSPRLRKTHSTERVNNYVCLCCARRTLLIREL